MIHKVIIRPEAEKDLKEAFLWYEEKRKGLGHDFLLHIDAGIKFISRNPDIYRAGYKGSRKHLVKRFPYKIFFLTEKDKLIVLAAIHSKRNPELTKKRVHNFIP